MRAARGAETIIGRRGDGSIVILLPTTDADATIGDMIVIHRAWLRDVIEDLAKHLDDYRVVFVKRR